MKCESIMKWSVGAVLIFCDFYIYVCEQDMGEDLVLTFIVLEVGECCRSYCGFCFTA